MAQDIEITARQTIGALFLPLARMMIDHGVNLPDAVELLKVALVQAAEDKHPDGSASKISLLTGVHRKDIRRLSADTPKPDRSSAAARVLTLWTTDPDFQTDGAPAALPRTGATGFDALVKRARVDAAPATMLALLTASGNVRDVDGQIHFLSAALVPDGQDEKLRAALATLLPHLETVASNLAGQTGQWDQALRYSHLTPDAARTLEQEASKMALDMLTRLNRMAQDLQAETQGDTLFVAGTFTHRSMQE